MTIREKLDLLGNLLSNEVWDNNFNKIDFEYSNDFVQKNTVPRGYAIAAYFREYTKDDLIYLNRVVQNLVRALGTNENIIDGHHITINLRSIDGKSYMYMSQQWIDDYKTLLKVLKGSI